MLAMQRRMSRPFLVLLSLPATAMGFALSVQISVLSWLLATRYGLHIDDIGFVWAAGPLAGIVGQMIVGVISDRVWLLGGRRRIFILCGSTVAALMIMALPNIGRIAAALDLQSIIGVAITVALALDLAINVSFNPTRSIIADITDEGPMRTRGYTWMQTVSGLFGVLAYAVGAIFGNDVLIDVAVVVVLLFSIVPALLIEEPRDSVESGPVSADAGPVRRGVFTVLLPLWALLGYDLIAMTGRLAGLSFPGHFLEVVCIGLTIILVVIAMTARDRGEQFVREDLVEFRKILAAHAFSWIGVQTMFVYLIAFVQQRFPGLSAGATGTVISVSFLVLNGVGALAPVLLLEPLALKLGQVRLHAACLAIMALGYAAAYALAVTPAVLYGCMALMGLGWAAIVSLPFAIMSTRIPRSRTGYYMGIFNLAVVIPQLFVSLGVGAFIARAPDKGTIPLISAAALGVSAALWLRVRGGTPDGPENAPPASH